MRHMIVCVWVALVAIGLLAGSPASAQPPRWELSVTAGGTLSEGVDFEAVTIPDVGTFDTIEPADAFSWGARAGYLVDSFVEIGVLFDHQPTTLDLMGPLGTKTIEVGDMNVYSYHAYIAYNFLEPDTKLRPYVLFGLGATQYGSVDLKIGNTHGSTDGDTQFSTTWAAGLKLFPNPRFGLRLEARYTPTFIKSDAAGWWCDPWWGCYAVEDAQYSQQWEFSTGITLRF
jgi:hypothetical protein